MRNQKLDIEQPEDEFIGDLFVENNKQYRIVAGKKITQIDEIDQQTKDLNLIINRERVKEYMANLPQFYPAPVKNFKQTNKLNNAY